LRVLSKQTLATSKEVKDSSVPGSSLAKEVKDPSLTILIQSQVFNKSHLELMHRSEGFSAVGCILGRKRFDLLGGV
jgi:hypothetical protein